MAQDQQGRNLVRAGTAETALGVEEPAAADPDQPWVLIEDVGQPLYEYGYSPDTQVRVWCGVVSQYADLQRQVPTAEASAVGVPDFTPAALPERLTELIDQPEWLNPDQPSTAGTISQRLLAAGAEVAELARQLDVGISPAIQHDDLHEANVMIRADQAGHPRLIDWGDAVISHPFQTMRITLRSLAHKLRTTVRDPRISRVADAYLEPWRADGWRQADLEDQLHVAWRLTALTRAHAVIRAVQTLEAARTVGYEGAVQHWLDQLLTRPRPDDLPQVTR